MTEEANADTADTTVDVIAAHGADASPVEDANVEEVETKSAEVETKESEAESPPAEETEDKPDPFQERIDKLTRRYRETERELKAREDRIAALESELAKKPEPAATKKLEDFDYDNEKYSQYLFDEAQKRAEDAAKRVASEFEDTRNRDRTFEQFVSREAEYARSVKDYNDVVHDPNLPINATMAQEIQESDLGPEVAYHLGKNPDLAAEIAKLPERRAIRRIAAIEAELRAEKSKTGNKVSKAPPPPKKIQAAENAGLKVSTRDPESDKLSDAEWFKLAEAEEAKRYAR